jgi:thioredoxin-like negative regulator of GroEL
MQYTRIGKEIGDLTVRNRDGSETVVREGEVRMAEIEYGSNKELCKSLGVTKLPSVHFYSTGKLVDGFPCGPNKIGMLLEKLTRFRSMSPAELEFEADMNQGIALGDSVLESLSISVTNSQNPKTALPSC